ncbi:MAG TPA: cytochrome b [Xanthomonadaceae bacterium]|nr:cytochrome b [Xanthomonadaceae bacterium]
MSLTHSPTSWGSVTIALHWLIVVLVLVMALVGLTMDEMPNSPTKVRVYALHKSTGLTILALMLLRLGWRLYAGRPEHVPTMPTWQVRAAEATHWLLYALLLAMPISGWIYHSASNFPLRWYGLFRVPDLTGPDPQVKALAHDAHEWIFIAICIVVLAHAGAALWHHFRAGDATLVRMLPRFARPPEPRA